MKVVLRKFDPKDDSGFIYSTLPKSIFFAKKEPVEISKAKWFAHFHLYMKKLLDEAKIHIASFETSPSVILGYSILTGSTLEYVYVKEEFRNQGIATLLTKNKGIKEFNDAHMTKVGFEIMQNRKEKEQEENDQPKATQTD